MFSKTVDSTNPLHTSSNLNKRYLFCCVVALALFVEVPRNATAQIANTEDGVSPGSHLSYDVATIKPNISGSGDLSVNTRLDTYSATNISLRQLLQTAYGVKENLIIGIPREIDKARFDVKAKILDVDPGEIRKMSPDERGAMLRPLLRERFNLKLHTELKDMADYELVQSGKELRLVRSPKNIDSPSPGRSSRMSVHNTSLLAQSASMDDFARQLSDIVGRTVVNKTGLVDLYDFNLNWSSEDNPSTEALAPSIFTALQEQLGLKLKSSTGPVVMLKVDQVSPPSEN